MMKSHYLEKAMLNSMILTPVLFFSLTLQGQLPDLVISEIEYPEYVSEIDGTVFYVTIANSGKVAANNIKVTITDLDVSGKTAKEEWQAHKDDMWIFAENESAAEENQEDYDTTWTQSLIIEKINSGSIERISVELKGYWIFDPNCEIGVIVDPQDVIQEINEGNNKLGFFRGG